MPTAVQFGAGNIGRGFMGHLFCEAGLETVFVDVVPEMVAALNDRRSYPLRLVGPDRHETLTIAPVRAVDGRDLDAVASELAATEIVCTAVGVAALPHVAPALARGLRRRLETAPPERRALNVLLCENQLNCADLLRGLVEKELGIGYWVSGIGCSDRLPQYPIPNTRYPLALIETVVARMVPVVPEEERRRDPLLAVAEDYHVLPLARRAVIDELPPIAALLPVDDLFPWTERKLYCHNLGHAAAAYLGYRGGHTTIDQAMEDPRVAMTVEEAMSEAGEALCRKHGFDRAEQRAFRDDLLRRFRNPALGDTVARVGRDPLRKLRPNDRLIGGLLLCRDEGVDPHGIVTAIAAALRYDAPGDPSAAELQERLRRDGLDAVLTGVCGLPPDSDAAGMIRSALERLPGAPAD